MGVAGKGGLNPKFTPQGPPPWVPHQGVGGLVLTPSPLPESSVDPEDGRFWWVEFRETHVYLDLRTFENGLVKTYPLLPVAERNRFQMFQISEVSNVLVSNLFQRGEDSKKHCQLRS